MLVHGDEKQISKQIEKVNTYPNIKKIIVAKENSHANAQADYVAHIIKALVQKNGYDKVIAAASAFGKDVVPRVGGLLDIQPLSDITQILVPPNLSI